MQCGVYVLFLALVSYYAVEGVDDPVLRIVVLLLVLLYAVHEMMQINSEDVMLYFFEIWNICDWLGMATFLIHAALHFAGVIEEGDFAFKLLLSVAVSLFWFKAIGYLRVFSPTRHLVRLVVEVIKDMRSFAVLLIVLWLQYAII